MTSQSHTLDGASIAQPRDALVRPPLRPAIGRANAVLDGFFSSACLGAAAISLLLLGAIGVGLYLQSALSRHAFGWSLIRTSSWDVVHGRYGALPFIHGTVVSSTVAMAVAAPLGLAAAIFLAEMAPRRLAAIVGAIIELLAAVPSIIFGLWGFFVLCPWLQAYIYPRLLNRFLPWFAGPASLTNLLAASLILALMVLPLVTAVSAEVMRSVSPALREGAVAMGATRWEMIRTVVLPSAWPGILGAIVLAFGRAIGETMAVVMVVGNSTTLSRSLLHPGYTMPALLANEFNEAFSIPLQRSALVEIALILFVITLLVNIAARLLIQFVRARTSGAKEASNDRGMIRLIINSVQQWAPRSLLVFLVAVVVTRDLSQHGVTGLFGPVEFLALAVCAAAAIAALTRNTRGWQVWRRWNAALATALAASGACIGCLVMGSVLVYVIIQGAGALNYHFFFDLPKSPDDPTGGMKNGILGTLMLVGIGSAMGVPTGVLGGIFLAEFRGSPARPVLRFAADVLNGMPSVVIGMFAYTVFVLPFKQFSALAGGAALAILMIPIVARTTEEMLLLVPGSLREAAVSLGATRWQAISLVVLPAARAGVMTGILLAVSRIAGETAPLLFTAFGSDQVALNPTEPVSSMTLLIYRDATSGYGFWVGQAWAGALVLLLMVCSISLVGRAVIRPVRRA